MAFSNPVVGGENGELIRASIQSPDYVTGVSGWSINRDGSAEFNNVTIRFDLATGSIVVGPDTGPQVVIRTDGTSGLIEFPTNAPGEIDPASIRAQSVGSGSNENEQLTIKSAETNDNVYARLILDSGDVDGDPEPSVQMSLTGVSGQTFNLGTGSIQLGDVSVLNNGTETDEVRVGTIAFRDGNYPIRVSGGIRGTGTTDTTLGNAVDTLVGGAASTSIYLSNGVAYRVDVQIIQRSSVGASAAGTQQASWKLWDGAVGGTQLGATVVKPNDNVGMVNGVYQFSFLFQFTGTTGSRTLNLSGQRSAGTDTLQARVNSQYFMLVNRSGDPAKITNL